MSSNPAAPARPAVHERPSPFTIPEPAFKFAEGPPSEPPPARSMTIDGLIRNLTGFADFYEQATADIESADAFEKAHHRASRDANADYYQRCFRATPGIDRVRAYVLAQYGEELTIGTARRVLGDLIRVHKLSVEVAGALSLEAAMDRLDGNGGTERSEGGPIPLRPDHLTQRGETPTLPATVRNWLTARYLADPTPGRFAGESEPIVFAPYEDFAEYLLNAGFDLLPNLDTWKSAGWIDDVMVDLTPTDNPTDSLPDAVARLNLPVGRHRLVGIRQSVLNAPVESGPRNSEESGAMGELPTEKVPGVVSLNVLRATLEMLGFPDWRKRFESWPEVPFLRLRCAELFPGQPFSSATIELLIAWFQERGLIPDQARHLPLSNAVRRLRQNTTVEDLVSKLYVDRPRDLDPDLADAFSAVATGIRECTRLMASVPYLWTDEDEYRRLAACLTDAATAARAAYMAVDIRLRRAGGPNPMLDALNDVLTVQGRAPVDPTGTLGGLNAILTRLYTTKSDLFPRVEGKGIIDRMLDQLARVPPTMNTFPAADPSPAVPASVGNGAREGEGETPPPVPVNPTLLDQAKQFLAEKDQEAEAQRVALRLLPYIMFPPNGPFGGGTSAPEAQSADGDSPQPATGAKPNEGGAPKATATRPARDPNQPSRDRQNDILAAIRTAGMPLMRPELIEAMKLKTEGKLGANLAWMVTNNVLINIPQRGYWPVGEPVPE